MKIVMKSSRSKKTKNKLPTEEGWYQCECDDKGVTNGLVLLVHGKGGGLVCSVSFCGSISRGESPKKGKWIGPVATVYGDVLSNVIDKI